MKDRFTDFETGLETLVGFVRNLPSSPAIIGIYGQPNSGKTQLRTSVARKLGREHIYGWHQVRENTIDRGSEFIVNPRFVIYEDIYCFPRAANYYLQQQFNKPCDLFVYIASSLDSIPAHDAASIDDFRLCILNENATKKVVKKSRTR
jgi:AAA+ ATPase superfamily predicted ATPase